MTPGSYVRTRGGTVLHLAGCRGATGPGAVPWAWAEGRGLADIDRALDKANVWVRRCRVCLAEARP